MLLPECVNTTTRRLLLAAVLVFGFASIIATGGSGGGGETGTNPPGGGTPSAAATWSKSFGGSGYDEANGAEPTRDGGYVFVGTLDEQRERRGRGPLAVPVDGEFWITKLDSLGDVEWQRAFGDRLLSNATDGERKFNRARASANGQVWLVGTEAPLAENARTTGWDIVVARLNADGTPAFARVIDTDLPAVLKAPDSTVVHEQGFDVWPLADGGAYVAAWAQADVPAAPPSDQRPIRISFATLLRLDAAGSVVWNAPVLEDRLNYPGGLPFELIVRPSPTGALIAVSARVLGVDAPSAVRLTSINSSGTHNSTITLEDLVAHDLIVYDGDGDRSAGDAIALGGSDVVATASADIGGLYFSAPDQRAVVVGVNVGNGAQIWRRELVDADDGTVATQVRHLTELCRDVPVGISCEIFAAGFGYGPTASGTQYERHGIVGSVSSFLTGGATDAGSTFLITQSLTEMRDVHDLRVLSSAPFHADVRLLLTATRQAGGAIVQRTNGSVRATDASTLFAAERAALSLQLTPAGGLLELTTRGELLAFSADGSMQWQTATDPGSERRAERAFAVKQTPDRGYLVFGASTSPTDPEAAPRARILKLDSGANVQWQRLLTDLEPRMDARGSNPALTLVDDADTDSDADDGFVVGGTHAGVPTLARFDANGTLMWTSDALDSDVPTFRTFASVDAVVQTSDGEFVASGYIESPAFNDERAMPWISRVTAEGSVRWRRTGALMRIDNANGGAGFTMPTGLAPLSGGSVVAAGVTADGGALSLQRISATGAVEWTRLLTPQGGEVGNSARIVVSADGQMYVGASYFDATPRESGGGVVAGGQYNVLIARLDAQGAVRWQRAYGAFANEFLHSLAPLADGGLLVAGRSDSLGDRSEAWLLRLGADGLVNAGCNALREPAGISLVEVGASALDASAPPADGRPASAANLVVDSVNLQPRTLSADAVVVARQCSGVAGPDPGTPPPPPPPGSTFQLRVQQNGSGTGPITSTPAGIVCGTAGGGTCQSQFNSGSTVFLRVDAGVLNRFQGWTGCDSVTGTGNDTCSVLMNADRTVGVSFLLEAPPPQPQARLTITQVLGQGRVVDAANRLRIDCTSGARGRCESLYAQGDTVNLVAEPEGSEQFLGWGGECGAFGNAASISIVMSEPRSCSAQFTGRTAGFITVNLTIDRDNVNGTTSDPGTVTIFSANPPLVCGTGMICSIQAAPGTGVTFVADVNRPEWEFESYFCPEVGVRGFDPASDPPRVSFAATPSTPGDDTIDCVARYNDSLGRLNVAVSSVGLSRLRIVDNASNLDCTPPPNGTCHAVEPVGRNVLLRARPFGPGTFQRWEDCDAVIADPDPSALPWPGPGAPPPVCVVTYTRERTVIAFVDDIQPQGSQLFLRIFGTNNGVVTYGGFVPACSHSASPGPPTQCTREFLTGQTVTLEATSYNNGSVGTWSGCDSVSPSGTQCSLVMATDRTVEVTLNP